MAKKNSRPATKTQKRAQKKKSVRTKTRSKVSNNLNLKESITGEVAKLNNRILDRCKNWIIDQNASENSNYAKDQPLEEIVICDDYDEQDHLNEDDDELKTEITKASKKQTKINLACEWKKCSFTCATYPEFQKHVDQHVAKEILLNEDIYECMWDLCSYKTELLTDLHIHIYFHVHHTKIKIFGEELLTRKKVPPCQLDSRRRNIIPQINPAVLICQWTHCERKFSKIYDLYFHLAEHCRFEGKLISSKTDVMKCQWNECTKEFRLTHRLVEHSRLHTKEKILSCPNCGSCFCNYPKFYDHFKRQGVAVDNRFQCVQCFKYFFTEELLNSHMYFHVNCYKCTMCDMTCPSPAALATHVRYKHISEKPFKCQLCKYAAVIKSDLDKHITGVHEKHIYECEEFGCGYKTESLFKMKKHDKNIHDGGPKVYCCHCCSKRYNCGRMLSKHLVKQHGFQLPSGHSRFTYRQDLDGFYRLQTMRTESLEVTQQIMSPSYTAHVTNELKNATFNVSELNKTNTGLCIEVKMEQPPIAPSTLKTDEALSMPDLYYSDSSESNNQQVTTETVKPLKTKCSTIRLRKRPAKSDGKVVSVAATNTNAKNNAEPVDKIQNFSVIKHYLKKGKTNNIIIELNEVDEAGNVVNTEVVEANEFCIRS